MLAKEWTLHQTQGTSPVFALQQAQRAFQCCFRLPELGAIFEVHTHVIQ